MPRTPSQRPRELRRRVILPARMRAESGWFDACILNISSRGLMIQVSRGIPEASIIELRRGEHVIVARVMWRDGSRAGLMSDDRLPVEQILSLAQAAALQLTAGARSLERRAHPRGNDDNRLRGRLFEFASIAILGASLAVTLFGIVEEALAGPMDAIRAALGG